jgi:hypothetical protein
MGWLALLWQTFAIERWDWIHNQFFDDGRYAQITSGNDAHAGNRFCFASISDAGRISVAARRCGQHRSDRSGRRQGWGASTVIARLVGARPQGGLARLWLPTGSLEEGLVLSPAHPLRRSISRMDQGIGVERDDFFSNRHHVRNQRALRAVGGFC